MQGPSREGTPSARGYPRTNNSKGAKSMNSFKHLDRTTKTLGVAGLAGVMMVSGCCTNSYKTASYKNTSYASAAPAESYSATTTESAQTPTPTGRIEESNAKNMVVP